jgi:hypothetical protein
MRGIRALVFAIVVVAGLVGPSAGTLAATPDQTAVQKILARYQSPLPWVTPAAFKASHEDFDLGGYLTVAFCESDYGTIGRSALFNNPGNIIARPKTWEPWRVWFTWQRGTFVSAGRLFGAYPDAYTGQRALIRLLYDHPNGYNQLLAEHRWVEFATKYWGPRTEDNAAAFDQYVRDLEAAHRRIVAEAARYGARW